MFYNFSILCLSFIYFFLLYVFMQLLICVHIHVHPHPRLHVDHQVSKLREELQGDDYKQKLGGLVS